jgi:hypothetical protein
MGANLKHGESVWHPITLNPVLFASNLGPTIKAIIVDLFLVKKYFPPFSNFQF